MADHLEEQEQIDAIKKWWNNNWYSVVLPLLAIVIAYGGWSLWQDYLATKAQRGSDAYEAILVYIENNAELTSEKQIQVRAMADALADDQSTSLYGNYAQLILAKLAMQEQNLELSATHLDSVVQNGANKQIKLVARSRLARVYLDLAQYDDALALVGDIDDTAFKSVFAEIRGDIFTAKGDGADAAAAYDMAMAEMDANQYARRNILQIKLDNVKAYAQDDSVQEEPVAAAQTSAPEDAAESSTAEATP